MREIFFRQVRSITYLRRVGSTGGWVHRPCTHHLYIRLPVLWLPTPLLHTCDMHAWIYICVEYIPLGSIELLGATHVHALLVHNMHALHTSIYIGVKYMPPPRQFLLPFLWVIFFVTSYGHMWKYFCWTPIAGQMTSLLYLSIQPSPPVICDLLKLRIIEPPVSIRGVPSTALWLIHSLSSSELTNVTTLGIFTANGTFQINKVPLNAILYIKVWGIR